MAVAVTVTPRTTDELLANPHGGWQTFHRTAAADRNLAGLPSGSCYFRFYWRDLEPADGEVDFARLDSLLAECRAAGQKLAFRIMCVGTDAQRCHVPEWLRERCPGFEFRYGDSGPLRWAPDMDRPEFLEPHLRLIRALGERYDGHPDVDLLDVGSVGLWGEWHMSGTGVAMPSLETRLRLVDAWGESFPRTLKVMLIGDLDPLRHALANGCGWRADCLGDMGGFSATWNHMEHFYRQQIEKAAGQDAWKTAPVAFESCWDMRKWVAEGWSVETIFDYALELHASYVNNKSAPLPEGVRPQIEAFLRKLGYRLELRRVAHQPRVRPGTESEVTVELANVGVAPPYADWQLALRLRPDGPGRARIFHAAADPRRWLPGEHTATFRVGLTGDSPPGRFHLGLALTAREGLEPVARFANEGRAADGWYELSVVEVG